MSIYPKFAASRAAAVKDGVCFVLMPFAREMRSVHATIKDVCSVLDMKCERADDIYSQRPIFSSILDSVLGRVDKRDSHRGAGMIQAGICYGDQLGTRPDVGRGMGVL
jgi:hypothetical protein